MIDEQITMRDLLRDPVFRKWMTRVPTVHSPIERPWRVWIQRERDNPWAMGDITSYARGYNALVRYIKEGVHDAALTCKVKEFNPPITGVKRALDSRGRQIKLKTYYIPGKPGQSEKHVWCTFCRRPTIFTTFQRHHTFREGRARLCDNTERRCAICGIRLRGMRRVYP